MIEVHRHPRRNIWERIKQDAGERFLKFETFNGAFIYIPWGWGFFYYGFPWSATPETFYEIIKSPTFGYNYGLMSTGFVLMFWGVRKTFVNRIKQQAKLDESVQAHINS